MDGPVDGHYDGSIVIIVIIVLLFTETWGTERLGNLPKAM